MDDDGEDSSDIDQTGESPARGLDMGDPNLLENLNRKAQ